MNRFPLKIHISEKILGTNITYWYNYLQKTKFDTKEDYKKIQENLLKKILHHSFNTVPYYRRIFKDIGLTPEDIRSIEDLKKIPILNKSTLKGESEKFLTKAKIKMRKYSTGGSTGEPLSFFCSYNHISILAAASLFQRSWVGWKPGDNITTIAGASIYKKPKTRKQQIYANLRGWLENNRGMSSFDLSREAILRNAKELQEHKTDFLRGLPSGLFEITRILKEEGISLPNYRAIFTTSEQLLTIQREIIEKYFQSPIYDQYGARDGGLTAGQCKQKNYYHYLPFGAIVEVVDENYEPVGLGEKGHVVLTDLNNFATPFIRYDVGDVVKTPEDRDYNCDCGINWPMFESIQGRIHDIIRAPNGDAVHGEVFSHIFRNEFPFVQQFQIRQKSKELIHVYVTYNESRHSLNHKKILDLLQRNVVGAEFEIYEVDNIPLTSGGKRRFVIGLESLVDY